MIQRVCVCVCRARRFVVIYTTVLQEESDDAESRLIVAKQRPDKQQVRDLLGRA